MRNVDSLKSLIEPSLNDFQKAVRLALVDSMSVLLDKHIGPKNSRIGVFGPNHMNGMDVTLRVAQMVSKLGYNAITEAGTLKKNCPDQFIDLKKFLPANVKKISAVIPDQALFLEMTRLLRKAVFFENEERGQYCLLRACSKSKISTMGFIVHSQISNNDKCAFLIDRRSFAECGVAEPSLCPRLYTNGFCPFYDSVYIPWFSKEILLSKSSGNRLIAVRDESILEQMVTEFVLDGNCENNFAEMQTAQPNKSLLLGKRKKKERLRS